MRTSCFVGILCLLSVGILAQAKDTLPRLKVTVIENLPTTTSYDWQVAGKSNVSCYSSGCTSYFTPSNSGTSSVNGAVLKLLLPDGRIVIAECSAKQDVAANWTNALTGTSASTVYRDCRKPEANSTIEAEFNRSEVKLFMQAPSIDGTGRRSSETYYITGVLQPDASQPTQQTVTVTVNNVLPPLKTYTYPEDGFSAAYPFEPQLTKKNKSISGYTIESHMYFAQNTLVGVLVIDDDYSATNVALVSDIELQGAKNDFLTSSAYRLISEKNITLGGYKGIEFEAESNQLHISARFYLADKTIYKTAVFTLLGQTYVDSVRFLDSFQLIPHTDASR